MFVSLFSNGDLLGMFLELWNMCLAWCVCGLEGMFCSGDGFSYVSDGYVGQTDSQHSMT
jgi:hypothetical protein